jgi:hypothetical protein
MAGECSPGMQRVDGARGNEKQIEETQAGRDQSVQKTALAGRSTRV